MCSAIADTTQTAERAHALSRIQAWAQKKSLCIRLCGGERVDLFRLVLYCPCSAHGLPRTQSRAAETDTPLRSCVNKVLNHT